MAVLGWLINSQVNHLGETMTTRHHNDENWQNKPHHKHRHKDADRQKYLLPCRAHASQHLTVNHRVVKAKRHFQHHQNSKQPETTKTQVYERQAAQDQCQ